MKKLKFFQEKVKKSVFLMVKARLRLHSWHLRDKTPLNVDAQGLYTKPCSCFRIPQPYLHIFCQSWCKELQIEAHLRALLVNYTFGFTRYWSTSRLSPEPWIDFSQKIYRCCRKVNFLNTICDFGLIWPAFSKKCKKIWWRDCHSQK